MLSYRHAFHAGNLADVHKHASLWIVQQALLRKAAPCSFIDTYAGAGLYELASVEARKTGEAAEGIGRLLAAGKPEGVPAEYLHALGVVGENGLPANYPGSPEWMRLQMRESDELVLLELHPAEHALLKARYAKRSNVHVHRRDAREGLPALVPPRHRRGLVLIDPPYEQEREYTDIPEMLARAWQRWPQAVYGVWYPLLPAGRHAAMLAAIAATGIRKVFRHELLLRPHAAGMRGSAMLWVNLPYEQDAKLRALGDTLCQLLGDAGAGQQADWLVGE